MIIFFKKSFIKDFQKLPQKIKADVRKICVQEFSKINSLAEFKSYTLKKLRGFNSYYRIKIGQYRIGLAYNYKNNEVVFMRVLHRKDIYKKFP